MDLHVWEYDNENSQSFMFHENNERDFNIPLLGHIQQNMRVYENQYILMIGMENLTIIMIDVASTLCRAIQMVNENKQSGLIYGEWELLTIKRYYTAQLILQISIRYLSFTNILNYRI